MNKNKLSEQNQLKLPGIRQLALALLITIVIGSIVGYLIIHQQQQRNEHEVINPVVIPELIKPKVIASNPQSEANFPMVFPLHVPGNQ